MRIKNRMFITGLVVVLAVSLLTGCSGGTASGPVTSLKSSGEPSPQNSPFGQPGALNSIGRYTPDRLYDIDPEVDAQQEAAQTLLLLQGLDAEDLLLVEELREGYEQKTIAEFRSDFNNQAEKSAGFIVAVSELTHAGIHNIYMDMDDFYCSLYFTLQNWYQSYGPANVRDTFYSFSYWRYLGEKQEAYTLESYDILKLVFLGYTLDIVYVDDSAVTVAQRDAAVVALVGEINDALGAFTLEQWNDPDTEATLYSLLSGILEKHSTKDLVFQLQQIDFLHNSEITG